MGRNPRIRINLVRKRFNFRNNKINKIVAIFTSVIVLVLLGAIVIGVNKNTNKTSVAIYDNDTTQVIASDSSNEKVVDDTQNNNLPAAPTETKPEIVNDNIEFTILGELMMGGEVTTKTNYLYNSAFKKIFTLTRDSDFTYTSLSTNITNLNKIENPKTKYIVTKEINDAIMSLGIDAVNVASDHMTDFPKEIFNNTLSVLKEDKTYIAGLNDSILYLEKGNKKIAIIAANNVFIGTKDNYTDYGINVYNVNKMKDDIVKAKQNADFVIVDVHWGREYWYGVTDEMKAIAYSAVDSGANLVMGSHALGIYPIITYKGVPIIYSTGYIMTDSDSELAKQSFIFNLNINKDNKITSLDMLPIYIKDKSEVVPYYEYDSAKASSFTNQLNRWNNENGLNSKVLTNKIEITF